MKQYIKNIVQRNLNRLGYQLARLPDSPPNPPEIGKIGDGTLLLCNFCGTIFRRISGFHSESLECPYCGSIARERVIYQCILLNQASNRKETTLVLSQNKELVNSLVLECSPRFNENRRTIYHETFKQYLASDYDMSAHLGDIRLDLTDIQDCSRFQNYFDVIICAHVLEHIPDFVVALRNLHSMLAPGGLFVLQVPILEKVYSPALKEEFHADHSRVYHHFGFDLIYDIEKIFREAKIVVGLLDFPITSPEVHQQKYEILKINQDRCIVLGDHLLKVFGLGIPDLCEAFIATK